MTEKQEKILHTALELFASEGYNSTPTSKIAKRAGVSEGLIFRHFQSKKGLLDAIMELGKQRMAKIMMPILNSTSPKQVIQETIQLPLNVHQSDYDYWRLQFKLKWEVGYNSTEKMQPLVDKLNWAFTSLNYKQPQKEAILLNQLLDTIAVGVLRDGLVYDIAYANFLLEKYQLTAI